MIQKIKTPVSVSLIFDHYRCLVAPQTISWLGRRYKIDQVGLHHTTRVGRTLYHIFSVAASGLFFRISLNTDNLHWILEEVSDGQTD